jgi:hypothetical protein
MTNIQIISKAKERSVVGINLKNLLGIIFTEWRAVSQPFCTVDIVDEKKPNGVKARGVIRSPIKQRSTRKIMSATVFPAVVAMLSSY